MNSSNVAKIYLLRDLGLKNYFLAPNDQKSHKSRGLSLTFRNKVSF